MVMSLRCSPGGTNKPDGAIEDVILAESDDVPDASDADTYVNIEQTTEELETDDMVADSDDSGMPCELEIEIVQGAVASVPTSLDAKLSTGGTCEIGEMPVTWRVDGPLGEIDASLLDTSGDALSFPAYFVGDYAVEIDYSDIEASAYVLGELGADAGEIRLEVSWLARNHTTAGDCDVDLHLVPTHAQGIDIDGDGNLDPWGSALDFHEKNASADWSAFAEKGPTGIDHDAHGAIVVDAYVQNMPTIPQHNRFSFGLHVVSCEMSDVSADVRVFVYGSLVAQWSQSKLVAGDFWHMGDYEWPFPNVTSPTNPDGSIVKYEDVAF